MIEIDGIKYYSEFDLNKYDLATHNELIAYFFSTSIEERQNNFLVYSPKALTFWVVPIKEKQEDNYKMFEKGISLTKYLEKKKFEKNLDKI